MTPRGRLIAGVAALVLAAAACSGAEPPRNDIGSELEDPPGGTGDPGGSDNTTDPGASSPSTVGTRPPDATDGPSEPEPSYADDGAVGAMARTYLRASPARRLRVEIDYIQGRRPSDAAVGHLRRVLAREAAKPDGVAVLIDDEIPSGGSPYSLDDIAALERAHRDRRSAGSVATLWLVYLDGQLAGESDTLGVAYKASAAAIFRDRIDRATTAAVQATAIERAVITHEAGHLLALVNLGYESPHDREDPNSRGHSTESDSVMRAAVEDLSLIALLAGGPPDDFDEFDRDDLDGLRQGRF